MRGQTGIGTIIILIAIILAAVVVAIVLLQITDSLRGQALLANRQAQQRMSSNIQILDVQAVVYKEGNTGDYAAYYLLFHVAPAVGAQDIDLKKVILSYSSNDVAIPGVTFVKLTDVLNTNAALIQYATSTFGSDAPTKAANLTANVTGACSATAYNIMTNLGTYNWLEVAPFIAPVHNIDYNSIPNPVTLDYMINHRDPSRFTALWEYCNNKDDIGTLSDGQTAYILYPLPTPAHSSDHIHVELHVTDGWSAPMDLVIPPLSQAGLVKVM